MEIYVAAFAALLASLVLAVVYAADRWEREPLELIQNCFLAGLLGQLVLVLAATGVMGELLWAGLWSLVTVIFVAVSLPFQLHRQAELDERFDGIVYGVAMAAGAACAVHLTNLPQIISGSPVGEAAAPGAVPDLRDLLILTSSPEFAAELGRGLVVIVAAVFAGAVLGTLHLRRWQPWRTALACSGAAVGVVGLDLAGGGSWILRWLLFAAAVVLAFAVKGRSVHRDRPQPSERDLTVAAVKTVLMIFGAALLATVVIQASGLLPEAAAPGSSGTARAEEAGPVP